MSEANVAAMKMALEQYEANEKKFEELAEAEKELKKELSPLKARLIELKKQFDSILPEYGSLVLDAVEIISERKKLADAIQVGRPGDWIVGEDFCFHGNLDGSSRDICTGDCITPNIVGWKLWDAIIAFKRSQRGGKK